MSAERIYQNGRTRGLVEAANQAEKTISEIILAVPMSLALAREVKQAILALREQTSDSNRPNLERRNERTRCRTKGE